LLSLLAAGPLEDVISMKPSTASSARPAATRFRRSLLGGVWYYRASDELRARLDALVGENRW
jgi:hypothetical protein